MTVPAGMKVIVALGVAVIIFFTLAPVASALYGDDYGAAPINEHPDAVEDVSAYPGDHAVWAGACDRGTAPPPGAPVNLSDPNLGENGFGQLPGTILANTAALTNPSGLRPQEPVPAPEVPDHCIDYGAPTAYPYQTTIWQQIPWSSAPSGQQTTPVGNYAPAWRLPAANAAGSHPDGTTTIFWARNTEGVGALPGKPDGSADNVVVNLPPGFVGDPTAVPKCSGEQFTARPLRCPPETQVGIIRLALESVCFGPGCNIGQALDLIHPVYNLEPRNGYVAELGFGYAGNETTVRIGAKARTNDDFGVTAFAGQIPAALVPISQSITIWGVPWAAHNDPWRAPSPLGTGTTGCNFQPGTALGISGNYIPPGGFRDDLPPFDCQQHYDPSWGAIRPFFTGQTECDGASVTTTISTDAYQHPGAFTLEGYPDLSDPDWRAYTVASPAVRGCAKVPFDPDATVTSTSTAPDSASGLEVGIDVPQNDDPPAGVDSDPVAAAAHWRSDAGLATAQLDKTVIRLPEGMSVNPSGATGLQACSDAEMGVTEVGNPYIFNNAEPSCPPGSYIGTAEATTPVLEGTPNMTGEVVLGAPKSTNPTSGQMFHLFLILRNEDRGLLAKIHGTSVANPQTGQITATFDKNPRAPVENIKVRIKGGDRGLLALPQTCGEKTTTSEFTPWTATHGAGGVVRSVSNSFAVTGDCAFGFAPDMQAGMSTPKARGTGIFALKFSRDDGEQWIDGLTASLPTGLLARVKGVPLCRSTEAAAGSCPAGSRVGAVDATAGSGTPFVLERKGEAFLTEGYKGCSYGLMVKVPVEAGPFRGALALSDIIVRQAICVDRRDAHVTAVSDPLPIIHHGIPLRMRSVTVSMDRSSFTRNPSGCGPKVIVGDFKSPQGATATQKAAFQATGCRGLPFKPKLTMSLTGKKQARTGKHPGVKAQVTQAGIGEAGIRKAVVRLPKSLALDPNNAQALCEFVDGTKDDLENHCPKGSIVGRAKATSPLLNRPLTGDVYFVKNVRTDRQTGNQIRTLPMIIVALRGEIAVNLRGESDTTKAGTLVNTFASVPDAPVSRFNLNIKGGKAGILAVTRTRKSRINLCSKPRSHVAEADFDGHNGKVRDMSVRMKTPCSKRRVKRN